MSENLARANSPRQGQPPVRFPFFMIAIFVGHTLAMAICLGIAALIFGLPADKLAAPFFVLAFCGIVIAPVFYLARVARDRWPKWFPVISGSAMFSYAGLLLLAVGLIAIRLHFFSFKEAVNELAGIADLSLAIAFIAGYLFARHTIRPKRSG